MALHEQPTRSRRNDGGKEDVALNWVDSTDGLIFSVSTYLSMTPKNGKEKSSENNSKNA